MPQVADYAAVLRMYRKYRDRDGEPLWKVFVRVGQRLDKEKSMQEVLDFLNSIEGDGYGGMASFEIARHHVRERTLKEQPMGYDTKCYDLAAAFLADCPGKNTEANRDKLAQHIQTEIESEIEFILEPVAPPRS